MIKTKNLIFDLDGTLWDATQASLIGWNKVAEENKEFNNCMVSEEELHTHFGLTIDKIAESLLSNLSSFQREVFLNNWYKVAQDIILSGKGSTLFSNVGNTLEELNKKYNLFIVSNCEEGYIESFYEAHGLKKYFKDYEYWGRTKLSKSGSIITLMKRNNISDAVYIGDTQTDCIAARETGIPFIYAEYGFGHCEDYDAKINSFSQLPNILD